MSLRGGEKERRRNNARKKMKKKLKVLKAAFNLYGEN